MKRPAERRASFITFQISFFSAASAFLPWRASLLFSSPRASSRRASSSAFLRRAALRTPALLSPSPWPSWRRGRPSSRWRRRRSHDHDAAGEAVSGKSGQRSLQPRAEGHHAYHFMAAVRVFADILCRETGSFAGLATDSEQLQPHHRERLFERARRAHPALL